MPKKRKTRSHEEGLWLITEDGRWIEVKKSVIKSDNIVPAPAIRYGKPYVENKPIELVENASFPVFREDHAVLIKAKFAAMDFTAEKLWPEDPIAETRYDNLISAIVTVSGEIPLASYQRYKIDRRLNKVEDFEKYQVVGVNESTNREILDRFPYLAMTHQIHEKDQTTGTLKVLPRIYYDLWLTEKLYELRAQNDGGRFGLHTYAQKLNNYPFPVMGEDGSPELDGDNKPMVKYEEAMLYCEGYVAQSGSSQQYHAFIVPVLVQGEEGEKFIFEMKLAKTIKKYTKLMDVPQEGEVPVTVSAQQQPLVMSSVAEMLKQITV
ncbi:hypothetical protein LCGC14_0688000 [marine sediment metagenome]|uniref:Uncharacterized protein n=1 Tax=marine sediment metagenome TaxID=412755 RepID=A0A0F9R6K7_9ZZZZ